MAGNISHYHYVQNKSYPSPSNKNQILWHNDLNDYKYEELIDKDFDPAKYFAHPEAISFPLKTIYPGLLIGSGYAHPALKEIDTDNKNDTGDFQLGFFFDHTTGLPVIPASSVKGVIKTVFPSEIKNNYPEEKKKLINKKNESKLKYINNILSEKNVNFAIDEDNWENVFFERKQVFLDAYITGVEANTTVLYKIDTKEKDRSGKSVFRNEQREEKHLFADDYITPHTKGIFKNPTPIRFLKIAPGVTFTFQFKLVEYKGENGNVLLKPEGIKELFRQILLDFGIGAKRNVGYGQFI